MTIASDRQPIRCAGPGAAEQGEADPFCGSRTTCLQALSADFSASGNSGPIGASK